MVQICSTLGKVRDRSKEGRQSGLNWPPPDWDCSSSLGNGLQGFARTSYLCRSKYRALLFLPLKRCNFFHPSVQYWGRSCAKDTKMLFTVNQRWKMQNPFHQRPIIFRSRFQKLHCVGLLHSFKCWLIISDYWLRPGWKSQHNQRDRPINLGRASEEKTLQECKTVLTSLFCHDPGHCHGQGLDEPRGA